MPRGSGREETPGHARRPRLAVAALASTATLSSFIQTIMTPLVPVFPETFDASPAAVAWVFTAPMLAASATAPAAGRLGDLYGKKRVLLVLLGIILAGSITGAFATTLGGVIFARALQGVGLGVMALNISLLRDVLPPGRVPGAVATIGASNGIGGALGLPLSALVSEWADWHGLFWLAAGLAAVSMIAVALTVPDFRMMAGGRFDLVGAVLLAIGLVAVMLGIGQGPDWGAGISVAVGLSGVAVLCLWVIQQRRSQAPVVDLRLMTSRAVLVVNLVTVATGFTWFAIPGLVARILQTADGAGPGFGLSMVTTSLFIVPTGLSVLIFNPPARRFVRRFGSRRALRTGSFLTALAYLFALTDIGGPWGLAAVAALVGIGSLLMMCAAPLLLFAHTPPDATGAANSSNAVMRWVGSTLSSATIGAVLAASSVPFQGNAVPTEPGYAVSFALACAVGVAGWALGALLPKTETPQL